MAGRLDGGAGVEAWTKSRRSQSVDDPETWVEATTTPTLNQFDVGDSRAVTLVAATLNSGGNDGGFRTEPGEHVVLTDGLPGVDYEPHGQDTARYKACGNGIIAGCAEYLGLRLAEYILADE